MIQQGWLIKGHRLDSGWIPEEVAQWRFTDLVEAELVRRWFLGSFWGKCSPGKTKDWLPKMGEKIGVFFRWFVIFCYVLVLVFLLWLFLTRFGFCRMAMSHHSFSTYTNWWSGNFFRDQTAGWSPEKWCFSKRILLVSSRHCGRVTFTAPTRGAAVRRKRILPNSHELRFRNYPNLARIVIEVWKVSLLNLLLSKHLDGPWRNCSLLWFTEIRTISSAVQFQPLYVSERGWTLNI